MTSTELRHLYFAAELIKYLGAKVILEETTPRPKREHLSPMMREHFFEFFEAENVFFEKYVGYNQSLINENTVLTVPSGGINDPGVVARISQLNPLVIAVHSTSLLKDPLVNTFGGRMFNLHAGLSPYYRGAGTNLFPFYNNELQYIGMTVHYMNLGIDAGDILLQGRPHIEHFDSPHTIGCKNVVLGTRLMIEVVTAYLNHGSLNGVKQDLSKGRLYLKKQFTDEVIKKVQEHLRGGIVETYADNPCEIELIDVVSQIPRIFPGQNNKSCTT